MTKKEVFRPRMPASFGPGAATGSVIVALVGAGVIAAAGLVAKLPNTLPDEAIYIELARHLDASGRSDVLGVPFPTFTYGLAYIALLAPLTRAAATARDAYMLIRGFNALVFASAAIPAYLIAIRAVSRRAALVVAVAAIAIPASAYTAKVMTENVAYAVVLWCVVAAMKVLDRPTLWRQVVLVAGCMLAAAARFELLVIAPALAFACVTGLAGSVRARLQRLSLLLVGTGALLVGALVAHATSRSDGSVGAHGFDVHSFSVMRFGALFAGSLGALDLYCGVFPFAVLLLFPGAIRRRAVWAGSGVTRLVVITCSIGTALLLTSSVYLATVPAGFRPPVPADRYTFYVVPLLFVVFAAWIEGGAIRESGTRWAAVAAGALPVLAALVAVSDDPHGTENGLAFLPWIGVSAGHETLLLALLAALGGFCVWSLTHRGATSSLINTAMTLITVSSICAFFFELSSPTYSPPPGWLDAHSTPGVIAVWTNALPAKRSQGLWEIDVANTNLSAIYFTREPDTFGRGLEARAQVSADGTLTRTGKRIVARYVLAPVETRIVGTVVAEERGFVIYRVNSRVRLVLPSTAG